MSNEALLIVGLIALFGSLHLVRASSAALGIPPKLVASAVRLLV
jgi:hypothetical protein